MAKKQELPGKNVQRQTSQRALIYEIIRKANGHVDAAELYSKARQKHPRISLSTVYRNLQLFKQTGLIEEHGFSEAHRHYEVKPGKEHLHLVCELCGKIVEFKNPLIQQIKREVERQHGFRVSSADLHLAGICPSCQRDSEVRPG